MVATPLGNLRDLTLRAVDILGSADAIAAEDTRVTGVLLRHFGIATRPISLHEHNEAARAAEIVRELGAGRSVALVSDAGTPAISDPGARLVRAVRAAGFPVVPIPGACAAIAAVSAAGLAAERLLFLGFLPAAAKARRELLASVAREPSALVIYEAPHRVGATVAELGAALGGDRSLVVARELTKKFETITQMTLAEAPEWFAADPNRERGEFVLLVDAPAAPGPPHPSNPRSTGVACSRRSSSSCRRRALRESRPPRPDCRATCSMRRRSRSSRRGARLPPPRYTGTMSPSPLVADPVAVRTAPAGWDARLELAFERGGGRTVLTTRRHVGPLRVQKSLHPEGPDVCQAIVVHPPGGIVGGDSLAIGIDAGVGAHAQLTTPGAAKWYRSAGPVAHAATALRLAAGAIVEWLPQETILFDGARASIALRRRHRARRDASSAGT